MLIYVQPITLPSPAAARPPGILPGRRQSPKMIQRPAQTAVSVAPEPSVPSTAIQLPSPDWQLELQRSARAMVERQAEADARQRSLDSRPKALQLPDVSTDPRPGDVAVLPNGDRLVTFGNGWTCTLSQPALDEAFSVWARFRPQKCTKKGGDAPGGKIELRRRDYLQGPPPEPPPAD
ncbi:MAG TPA: hypothetical protein VKO83_12150 [Steroidobacteraceae bacterium]|nr:hypothetical protein [Steroidobacteraceae bacterium]